MYQTKTREGSNSPLPPQAASDAPVQPNITTQGGKRMAGALKFEGHFSSLVNSIHPLGPSSIATSSMKPSMTTLPLCVPTACVLLSFRVLVTWVCPGLLKA